MDENRSAEQEKRKHDVKAVEASVKTMEDFTSPEVLYDTLISGIRKYHPSTDLSMIEKAYRIAYEAHKDQRRKSGEPYIIHPLCVAIILADLELDKETIVAGLLHDVVEDTVMTIDELSQEFGPEVALLVDGVTKLGQLSYSADKVEEMCIRDRFYNGYAVYYSRRGIAGTAHCFRYYVLHCKKEKEITASYQGIFPKGKVP